MLTNANILRIDTRSGATAAGEPLRVTGDPIDVRCFVDAVSNRQRYTLGAAIDDADRTVFLRRAALAAPPAIGDVLIVRLDGDAEDAALRVVRVGDARVGGAGGISHLELFVAADPPEVDA